MLDEDLKKAMSAETSRAGTTNTKTEDRYLIEREGQPLGMIVSEPHGFVVYACAKQIWPITPPNKLADHMAGQSNRIAFSNRSCSSSILFTAQTELPGK